MTVNVRTRRGWRYIEKHGRRKVFLDGAEIFGCFYTDTRRGVVRAFVGASAAVPAVLNHLGQLETYELRGRRITFEVIN